MSDDTDIILRLEKEFAKIELSARIEYDPCSLYTHAHLPILDNIAKHFGEIDGISCTELIEKVRNYVNVTQNGKDDYPNPPLQIGAILTSIYRVHEGKRSGAGILCCACATSMGAILTHFGIENREIALYTTCDNLSDTLIQSHALLEVFNKDTNHFEIHDPQYNVAYGLENDNDEIKNVSAFELFSADKDKLRVIQGKYIQTSNDLKRDPRILTTLVFPKYTDIVVSRYLRWNSTVLINIKNVNFEKRFSAQGNKNIIEHLNSVLHDPVIFQFASIRDRPGLSLTHRFREKNGRRGAN